MSTKGTKGTKGERPWVSVNFAVTWDGRISTRNRTPSDFSSPRDKRRLLEIRARADAVLVGAGTVAADQMIMGLPDSDLREARIRRGQPPYPLRVLLTNSGRIDPALRLFKKKVSPIVIFSTERMPRAVRAGLEGKADVVLTSERKVDLGAMLAVLRKEYGVKRVDCEGGGQVCRALLELDLIDEIHLTLSPRLFGSEKAPTITGVAGEYLAKSVTCALRSAKTFDGECFLNYRVRR
jgi:riboflavin-specific deaminase-like protein